MCYGNYMACEMAEKEKQERTIVAMEIAGAEAIPECNTRPTEIDQSRKDD